MTKFYLEFEKPLKVIDEKIISFSSITDLKQDDISSLSKLKEERTLLIREIYSGLSRWQRIQLARHPDRPFSMDYINYLCPDFIELHGDRHFMDDPAVIAGFGKMDDRKIALIGQQKGRNTKENLYRNFGMMRPEGYRKAIRIMKLAEKFKLPVITLMDSIGAYPGIGGEERGPGDACDRMLMMENSWYSVISPEGCASILFRDAKRAEDAAEALKPTPADLEKVGICERIIEEPNGGAHRDFESSASLLKSALIDELDKLSNVNPNEFLDNRINKYAALGYYEEG